MKRKSFEELLDNKTADFLLTPKEGLWERIEEQLLPEKRKRRALWLWLPASIIVAAGIITYSILQHPITSVSMSAKHPPAAKTQAAGVPYKSKNSIVSIQNGNNDGLANENNTKPYRGFNKSDPAIHDITITRLDEDRNHSDRKAVGSAEYVPSTILTKPEDDVKINPEQAVQSMELVQVFSDTTVLNAAATEPLDTAKKHNLGFDMAPAIINQHTFYIGMMFTPLQSNSLLTLSQPDALSSSVYKNRKATDKAAFGYGAALSAGCEKGRHQFYAGIQYQSLACQMLVRNLVRKTSIISAAAAPKFRYTTTDTFALADSDSGGTYVTGHFNYLSIPMGYTYQFIKKQNFSVGLTSNLSYNLLLKSDALLYDGPSGYYLKRNASNNSQLQKSNLMWSAGLDFDYRLNHALVLTFRPQFGCTLTPSEKAAVNTGLKYWGIGVGLKWYVR